MNKLHLMVALRTTKSHCLFLMKQFFYLYSATMFEVKDSSPCDFIKPVKKTHMADFQQRDNSCVGERSPLRYKYVSLYHLRLQPLVVLISLYTCEMHVGYFTIQTAETISISNQDSSLARASYCCDLPVL